MNTAQSLSAEELKLIDFLVLVDHSGSMGNDSTRFQGKTRLEEVREDAIAIARLAEKFDEDGITAIGFSSGVNVKDGVKAAAVAAIFEEFSPRGSTNLTAALEAAVEKVKSSAKEGVVIVFTDGAPDSESTAMKVIEEAGKSLGRPKIGFVFIQVGNDSGAAAFLKKLDEGMKVDVCATVGAAAAESLSVEQLGWLARNS